MFNSLSEFYNSELWKAFRLQLIFDRTNKQDGILYCEYSRKPIVKQYDIVAHHIQPLTTKNVNDYTISLNPENIMLVSQRSHNEIHKRFGFSVERKVYFVYGAPCSGKTTFVNEIKGNSDLIVDMDNIWECITGTRYHKPNALKANAFLLRDCLLDMVKMRAGKWERAYVIMGGARKGERERYIRELGAEPIFINTDKQTCLQRLASGSQRDINAWAEYINTWFEDYQE